MERKVKVSIDSHRDEAKDALAFLESSKIRRMIYEEADSYTLSFLSKLEVAIQKGMREEKKARLDKKRKEKADGGEACSSCTNGKVVANTENKV